MNHSNPEVEEQNSSAAQSSEKGTFAATATRG